MTALRTGLSGAITVILVFLLSQVGVDLPPEVAGALGTIVAALVALCKGKVCPPATTE